MVRSLHRFVEGRRLIAVLAMSLVATQTLFGAEDAGFERVFPAAYNDMLMNSKKAYGDKRYDEAFPLARRAACAGDKESQWMVGHMYLLGQGVERNDLAGYSWLKAAAEFQSQEYRDAIDQIEHAIDPKQLASAKAAAQKFVDAYDVRATHMSCAQTASRHGHILDRITCTPQMDGQMMMLHQCLDPAPPPKAKP